jgi:signal transduction histidine kinase
MIMNYLRSTWWKIKSVPIWLKIVGGILPPTIFWSFLLLYYIRQDFLPLINSNATSVILSDTESLLAREIGLSIVGTFILGGLFLSLVHLFLIRPLEKLESGLKLVQGGEYSSRLDIWADDEIGQVQAAFNSLVSDLENTETKFTKLDREFGVITSLIDTIAVGQSVDDIIDNTLRQTVALMGAYSGSQYLLDDTLNNLVLKSYCGGTSPELLRVGAVRKLIDSPQRHAIETGHTYITEDIRPELPPPVDYLMDREGFISWASAPIKAHGRIIGTINLYKRKRESFTPRDGQLLEVIGSIIGLIIDNSYLLETLRSKEQELRRALNQAVAAQEEERKRLSRELHDEIGQALTSLLIRYKVIQAENDIQAIHYQLNSLRSLTSRTIRGLRRLALDLRPTALDDLGIIAALQWYVQQCREYSKIPIQFSCTNLPNRLPAEVEVVLYRVAQEGVTNAIRYSHAKQIDVKLEPGENSVRLIICDDGRGFDPKTQAKGIGLIGIRERVELLKGSTVLETRPGAGTQLYVEIPFVRNEMHS